MAFGALGIDGHGFARGFDGLLVAPEVHRGDGARQRASAAIDFCLVRRAHANRIVLRKASSSSNVPPSLA